MIISDGTVQDVHEMLQLDYKIFPKEWHLSEKWVREIIMINPHIYRVIRSEGHIKGYYCFYPIPREPYERLLSGEIHEYDIVSYLLNYTSPCEAYLYFLTIIVDINDPNHKTYARQLIQDIPKFLNIIMSKGVTVKEIGAIAISEAGIRILGRMGLTQTLDLSLKMGTRFIVYKGKPCDLIIDPPSTSDIK